MHWEHFWGNALQAGDRYFIIAGIAFLVFYVLLRGAVRYRKIQPKFPKGKDYAREIVFSTISVFIFACVPMILVGDDHIRPHTTWYPNIGQHGWFYFFAAFPVMFLIHDTYFYWMHRIIHHPVLFRWIHLVHHRSTNPSPWAAYAFHPVEALLEAQIFTIFLFTIPITRYHLLIFFILSLAYNVYGHLGFELYPKGFDKSRVGRWVNTSVCHNQHHHYFKGNYGLYFLFWDRWMGTIRQDYDAAFQEVKSRQKGEAGPSAGTSQAGINTSQADPEPALPA